MKSDALQFDCNVNIDFQYLFIISIWRFVFTRVCFVSQKKTKTRNERYVRVVLMSYSKVNFHETTQQFWMLHWNNDDNDNDYEKLKCVNCEWKKKRIATVHILGRRTW